VENQSAVSAKQAARKKAKAEAAAQAAVDYPEEVTFEPAPARRQARQPARDATRAAVQHNPRRGATVATGRDGEILTRRRTQVGDQYHVPPEEIPDGWDYQWNPVTVLNQEVLETQNTHYANGWRPVPAERHSGRWTRPGHSGDIVVGGLRLEERPESLTFEALAEEEAKARRQVREQSDILRMARKMPAGFTMEKARNPNTGGNINITIDKHFDLPPGEYQPPDDSIE
jgi:hypothetical protein